MIRRWQASADRARRYGAPGSPRIALRGTPLRFEWLRRRRTASPGARSVLHARVSLGVSLHMHSRHVHPRTLVTNAPARVKAMPYRRSEALRHERMLPAAGAPTAAPTPAGQVRTERIMRVRSHTRLSTVFLRERLADRVLSRSTLVTAQRLAEPRGDRVAVPDSPRRAAAHSAMLPIAAPSLRKHAGPARRLPLIRTAIGDVAARRRRMPSPQEEGVAARPAGNAPLRLEMVGHREQYMRQAAPVRAFAAQQQPLAIAAARTAPVEAVPVERIERTLRESLTVVAERTVQREVARALRSGAPTSRRLRESIQSEMYDDIVFERERRGER